MFGLLWSHAALDAPSFFWAVDNPTPHPFAVPRPRELESEVPPLVRSIGLSRKILLPPSSDLESSVEPPLPFKSDVPPESDLCVRP